MFSYSGEHQALPTKMYDEHLNGAVYKVGGACWLYSLPNRHLDHVDASVLPPPSTEITASMCPDCMSSSILNYGEASLMNRFTSLLNISWYTRSIPDCWRPVNIAYIFRAGNRNIPAKYFRPVAVKIWGIKLRECAFLRRQTCVCVPDKPFQFVCEPSRSTVDAEASLVHYITKSVGCICWIHLMRFLRIPLCLLEWSTVLAFLQTTTVRQFQAPPGMAIRLLQKQNSLAKTGMK